MHRISPDQLTPAIIALFDFSKPTMPRAFNVLEGTTQGQILLDDPHHPTWTIVRDSVYGTLYLGGAFTPALLARVVNHFRAHGDIGISCWPDDPLFEMLPAQPDYDGATVCFTERSANVVLSALLPDIAPGLRCVLRGKKLLPQSFDYDATLAAFGTVEHVLRLTHGVMILDGQEVVCEAATGAATHGRIEVGVSTAEAYRQRGCATIACAKLIELCEQHGYTTWWDCAKHNTASVRLARKLGYQNEREYRYVWWAKRG